MKIGVTLGTRPEIIKLAPVIQALRERQQPLWVIHTNQHYDAKLDRRFFEELELPTPDVNLNVGSGSHGLQTARMLEAIEHTIGERGLTHMIVQGDTNSGLAGALAASKLSCQVVHVEAGLRSYDPRMPEEVNRRLIDHISNDLFPPTETARDVLLGEAVIGRVHEPVGNTVVDAVLSSSLAPAVELDQREPRILLTLHRPENVDDESTLRSILTAVGAAARRHGLSVAFPAHPRTLKRMEQFSVRLPDDIAAISPQSFGDVLRLQASARLVITDSGGLQEEACVLRTPCVVVRTHTDRPEALAVGSAVLAGTDEEGVESAVEKMLAIEHTDWPQPFGDGTAGRKIVETLTSDEPAAAVGI
jgi:UDP-N-acetylglucosamine 2-epimerase (non-hydrolysing)